MDLKRDIKPITYMKNHAAELVRDISENGRTVAITQNGEVQVVMMDVKMYEEWLNTLAMLKMASFAEAGKTIDQDKVFKTIEREFFSKDDNK